MDIHNDKISDTELSEVEGKNVCDGRLLQNNLPTGAEPWGFKVKRGKTSLADCQSYCKRRRTECQFMNWVEESQMCCIFKNCPNPSNYAGIIRQSLFSAYILTMLFRGSQRIIFGPQSKGPLSTS